MPTTAWILVVLVALAALLGTLWTVRRRVGARSVAEEGESISSQRSGSVDSDYPAITVEREPSGANEDEGDEDLTFMGSRSELDSDRPKAAQGKRGLTVLGDDDIEPFGVPSTLDFEADQPTGPIARILVSAYGNTDAGLRRKRNEDAILVWRDEVFVVADGMGGHAKGDVASRMAIETMQQSLESQHDDDELSDRLARRGRELVQAVRRSNMRIFSYARESGEGKGMGTTMVAARFSPSKQRVYVANVGDSRCYRLRNGELVQLTRDHTMGAYGVTGRYADHLVRAVGIAEKVDVDLTVDEPDIGDRYMLCSDGLFKMVPEERVLDIVNATWDIEEAVTNLIEEANERGGKDNVSVILVGVLEPDSAS